MSDKLAAEREKVAWCEVHRPDETVSMCPACECVHLSDKLNAEREQVEAWQLRCDRREQQLATLQDALNWLRSDILHKEGDSYRVDKIDAALAKVKE